MSRKFLKKWLPRTQLEFLTRMTRCADGIFTRRLLEAAETTIRTAPSLAAIKGAGIDARIVLHYFYRKNDFWITGLDRETGQSFGYACIDGDPVKAGLGYLSIPELIAKDKLLFDIYWPQETTLKQVMTP